MYLPRNTLTAILLIITPAALIAGDKLEIEDAWIAEAPPVSKVMAAYMTIENETSQARKAVSMQCKAFDRAEFHRTVDKDGIARMEHQETLTIGAKAELKLVPGGYHIMLFNPSRPLKAGDETDCSMQFDDGTVIDFDLDIKKAFEDHSHHHHHH